MREFAERQDRFMRNTMETGPIGDEEEAAEPSGPNIRREYDCVHCHGTQPSTQDQPMGLVVLLQATSVLGHKHKTSEGLVLPVREEERDALAVDDSLAAEYESRFEELSRHFDTRSHLLAVNTGWQVTKYISFFFVLFGTIVLFSAIRAVCSCNHAAITSTWLVTRATCRVFEGRVLDPTTRLWRSTGGNMFAQCADSSPTLSSPSLLTWRDRWSEPGPSAPLHLVMK